MRAFLSMLFAVLLGLSAMLGLAEVAMAQSLNVVAATDLISGDVQDAIVAVGMALIALAAIVLGLKWIKAAFF